ncbi:5326_t:CDS:2 [Diversispora eburnea]|uniref:5326_t:CDS:1 n=1 Tax=Diversispora eburnea TaxID=1213867 RepID=A0A9N9F8A7_9GLOM|nr:5326_t:CDS:2 [Diversispora eburnea]
MPVLTRTCAVPRRYARAIGVGYGCPIEVVDDLLGRTNDSAKPAHIFFLSFNFTNLIAPITTQGSSPNLLTLRK